MSDLGFKSYLSFDLYKENSRHIFFYYVETRPSYTYYILDSLC